MIEVSVIIPIYNGEEYIEDLYERLKNQSYSNFEVLFVDDGSKDSSFQILNSIIQDERMSVLHKENGGICSARNLGLRNSTGEYIVFLDQDDKFDNQLIEDYFRVISTNQSDMAVFSKIRHLINEYDIDKKTLDIVRDDILSSKEKIIYEILNLEQSDTMMTIWNCIYRRSIIDANSLHFDEYFKMGNEDGMFNMQFALLSENIILCSRYHYEYYLRVKKSTTAKYNPLIFNDIEYFLTKMEKLLNGNLNSRTRNIFKLYEIRFLIGGYYKTSRQTNSAREKKKYLQKIRMTDIGRSAISFKYRELPYKTLYYFILSLISKMLKAGGVTISMYTLDIIKKIHG